MKQLAYLILLLLLTACSPEDDPIPSPPTEPVVNSNKNDASENPYLARLEMPKTKAGSLVITHIADNFGVNYSVEWDSKLKAQRWTCYQFYENNFTHNGNSRSGFWPNGDPWAYDPNVPMEDQQARTNELSKSYFPNFPQTLDNYFQKGHICPSADRLYSKEVNEQTYYMTNILPMVAKFNLGIWGTMENKLRAFIGETMDSETFAMDRTWNNFCDTLFVCKGGTIDKAEQILGYTVESAKTSGETELHPGNHIIPRFFFMALLAKKGDTFKALGFWVEHLNEDHSKDPLANYVVNIDKLEELTGIDFFCNLPDDTENKVESATADEIKSEWGL